MLDLQSKLKALLLRLKPKKAEVPGEYEPKLYSSNVQEKVDRIGKEVAQLQNAIEELYGKRSDLRKEKKFEKAMEVARHITTTHQRMEVLIKDAEKLMNEDRKNL